MTFNGKPGSQGGASKLPQHGGEAPKGRFPSQDEAAPVRNKPGGKRVAARCNHRDETSGHRRSHFARLVRIGGNRAHVLGALERSRVFAVLLAQAALELLH